MGYNLMMLRKLSVIVPAYNEERTIKQTLERLVGLKLVGWKTEIIVVSDGSTDNTDKIIRNLRLPQNAVKVFKPKNQGKGAAIKTGLLKSTGEYVIIQDADLEYNPQEIKKLVKKAEMENLSAVFGTRNKGIKNAYKYPVMFWGARVLYWLINLVYKQDLSDPENCYKLVKRKMLDFEITEKGFGVEVELVARLAKKGIKIAEVPIRYTPRGYSEGKKITIWDGVKAIWLVFKFAI